MANKRVRMTVEFDINEDTLIEKGLQLEDVLNGLAFHESDVSDGFEITTNIPGCDCTADFFLTAGTVVGVEEIEPPKANRLDKINSYKSNAKFLQDAKEQKIEAEVQELCARIRDLKPRIDELLATGNACLENGIELTGKAWGGHEGYDTHQFISNSWSHLTGFIQVRDQKTRKPLPFTKMGKMGGGACDYNLTTDGTNIDVSGDRIFVLKRFLEDFDTFETEFYKYVDKVIEKQQSSVDSILADAKGRSVLTTDINQNVSKDTIEKS